MKKIAPKLVQNFVEEQQLQRQEPFGLVYSEGLSMDTRSEVEALARTMGFQEILWVQTGCVVSTHGGPGAFGICGFSPNK